MEENKDGGNGELKQEPQFDTFIKIYFNTKTMDLAFETNVSNMVTGYGLLEFGKKGVDNHIAKVQQKKVIQPKGGMMDFARRILK